MVRDMVDNAFRTSAKGIRPIVWGFQKRSQREKEVGGDKNEKMLFI